MKFLPSSLRYILFGALFIGPINVMAFSPNDPYFSVQKDYLGPIQIEEAWDITTGGSNVIVAVIDDGVDTNHTELSNNIWTNTKEIPGNSIDDDLNGFIDDLHGWDFAFNTRELTPTGSHGTQVAGIISGKGDNGYGIAGVSWRAKIMPLIVFDFNGRGSLSNISKALHYATDNGANVINLSLGGAGYNYDYNTDFDEAITYAFARGVTIVVAAGNGQRFDGVGRNLNVNPNSPVCNDGKNNMVVGVAALHDDGTKTSWSDYGSNCIDVAAPGFQILSTTRTTHGSSADPDYSFSDGTSFASPIVSGVVALIKSFRPDISNVQIMDILRRTADNIDALNPQYAGQFGAGRVNAYKAVTALPNSSLLVPDLIAPIDTKSYWTFNNARKEKYLSNTTTIPRPYIEPYFEWEAATDSGSGIKGYYALWTTEKNGDATKGSLIGANSFTVPKITQAGTYYLHLKAVDQNNNISSGVYFPFLSTPDLTIPSVVSKTSVKPYLGNYYTRKLRVELSSFDLLGTPKVHYKIDSSELNQYNDPIIIPAGVHTLTFFSIDENGNKSQEFTSTYSVFSRSFIQIPKIVSTSSVQKLGTPVATFRVVNTKELSQKKIRIHFTLKKSLSSESKVYFPISKKNSGKLFVAHFDKKTKKWVSTRSSINKNLQFIETQIPQVTSFSIFLKK